MCLAFAGGCRDLHQGVSRPDLEGQGLGGSLELLDEGADVPDRHFGGAERSEAGGGGVVAGPEDLLADVQADGSVAGDERPGGEERRRVGQRCPRGGGAERRERALLGCQRQGLGDTGIAGVVTDPGQERMDHGSRHAGARRFRMTVAVHSNRHVPSSDLSAPWHA